MESLLKYFPQLTDTQIKQFSLLGELYPVWNEKINVISRKDIANLYVHHVLHSLAIAKFIRFTPESNVLDVGTGGGFPGIPLAIFFPEVNFTLIDSIGKKIRVVEEVSSGIGLKNVKAIHGRAEKVKGKFNFIVSRAVTELPRFISWVKSKVDTENTQQIKNGILYLKGGDISHEIADLTYPIKQIALSEYFTEEFFQTKLLVHISVTK